jgi:hypothetical protein
MRLAKPWSRGHWRRARHELPLAVRSSAIEGGSQIFTYRARPCSTASSPTATAGVGRSAKSDVLPHFPPVLHRGGCPDGR